MLKTIIQPTLRTETKIYFKTKTKRERRRTLQRKKNWETKTRHIYTTPIHTP